MILWTEDLTMAEDYKPRFVFEISYEQKIRSERLLGVFGIRRAIFQPILDDVLDMIERHGDKFVGAMVSGMVKPNEVLSSMAKARSTAEEITKIQQ
jgi:hypothetical protein